jgi:hypothetical protein
MDQVTGTLQSCKLKSTRTYQTLDPLMVNIASTYIFNYQTPCLHGSFLYKQQLFRGWMLGSKVSVDKIKNYANEDGPAAVEDGLLVWKGSNLSGSRA